VAEHEALIISLKLALEMHIDWLEVFGDSQLIIRQIHSQYEVRNAKLVPVHQRARSLTNQFVQVQINHAPRFENDKADALAKLADSLTLPDEREIQITIRERHLLASALDHFEIEEETDWRQPLIDYIQYGILPTDLRKG